MNNFGVGYAENLKNGCNSHGEAIILNPSRRDTTIIHSNSKSLDRVPNLFVGATCGRPQNVSILSETS